MAKRMLINAAQKEELRVALVEGQQLCDLDIERTEHGQTKANIYKGRISRIEPSLEAAFVEYGSGRHGFLPMKEVAREYFKPGYKPPRGQRPHIKDALVQGQEIIIQVDKEERGNKGAALTTFVGLAGCYLVLMPNNPRAGGISRRIEGEERDKLRETLSLLTVPEGMGLIIRTNGVGRSQEELQWDLEVLLTQWNAIQEAAEQRPAPFLIYQESDVIIRAMRDYLRPDVNEILIDNKAAYERAKEHIQHIRSDYVNRVKLYEDPIPLFNRYQIESQIETAFQRIVQLENGGSIVIDPTEAMVSIDINSAKATAGTDIEDTAFKTNMAAAKEIARQLRLRDIGGLIVIDFIDMGSFKNQRAVENKIRDELKADRARTRMGRISSFGLLEMSRQRLRPSLGDSSQVTCPRCDGQGTIRNIQSLALAILRIIEDESMKPNTAKIQVQAPVNVATYMMNEKRNALFCLEKRHDIHIIIVPNPDFLTPHYEVARIREDAEDNEIEQVPSYSLATKLDKTENFTSEVAKQLTKDEPAIKSLPPTVAPKKAPSSSLVSRLWNAIFSSSSSSTTPKKKPTTKSEHRGRPHSNKYKGSRPPRSRDKHGRPKNRPNRDHSMEQDAPHRHHEIDKPESRVQQTPVPQETKNETQNRDRAATQKRSSSGRHSNRPNKHSNQDHTVKTQPYEKNTKNERNVSPKTPVVSYDPVAEHAKEQKAFHEQQMAKRIQKKPENVAQETFKADSKPFKEAGKQPDEQQETKNNATPAQDMNMSKKQPATTHQEHPVQASKVSKVDHSLEIKAQQAAETKKEAERRKAALALRDRTSIIALNNEEKERNFIKPSDVPPVQMTAAANLKQVQSKHSGERTSASSSLPSRENIKVESVTLDTEPLDTNKS